jgi:hypothetical protein
MRSQINIQSFSPKRSFLGGSFGSVCGYFRQVDYSTCFSIEMSDLNGENVSLKLEIGFS